MEAARPGPALEAGHVSKSFAGIRVLDGLSLRLEPGDVHALVGHNGSGKSTFVKILAGQYVPDPDSDVALGGQPLAWGRPREIAQQGLRVVHQHLGLVDGLSVTENVMLGFDYSAHRLSRIRWNELHEEVAAQLARIGYTDVDPRHGVAELSSSARSGVAVARAMMPRHDHGETRVVLLDEVTATMPEREVERIGVLVSSLAREGVAVLYVTHHLDEVFDMCNTVTVLKDGRRVFSDRVSATDHQDLADRIVGSTTWRREARSRTRTAGVSASGSRVLAADDLYGEVVAGVSFAARTGRVLGVAGIAGSGREEMAGLLVGEHRRAGTVTIDGEPLESRRPASVVRSGVALLPADRARKAVVPNQNVRENLVLSRNLKRRVLARTSVTEESRTTASWIERLNIRGASVDGSVITLSGGNQQKVVLARCLTTDPSALLLDEPTQAVDVGAMAEIHRIITEVSATAIVVVCSSDNHELAELCDDVIVLYRGRVVAVLSDQEISAEKLDHLVIGSFRADEVDIADLDLDTDLDTELDHTEDL